MIFNVIPQIIPIVGNTYKCTIQTARPVQSAEHKFQLIKTCVAARRSRQILVTENLDYESTVISTEVSQDSEDGSAATEFADTDRNAEDSTESNNNFVVDQNDNIQSHLC